VTDYVLSVRKIRSGAFVAESGPSRFLVVPPGADPAPVQAVPAPAWYKRVRADAAWANAAGEPRGDVLFVVHGYNTSETEVMQRHRRLRDDLVGLGFRGVVVSFDWPSDDKTLAYLPDRHRAKQTALQLVSDGIEYLSGEQTPDCTINVHLLGHSTGAYVIREALDDADDTSLPNSAWGVSQLVFAAGDVSSASMSAGAPGSDSLYRHSVRVTNYSSRHDEALDLSNVKRLGVAPRVGRVGLPGDAPGTAVNVDCSDYYEQLVAPGSPIAGDSPSGFSGLKSHAWYFGNRVFTKDLFATVIGTDRSVIPTRQPGADGKLRLRHVV
jgi:pimeloyl-ACP methyl ester carboxylesterase